MSQFEEKTIEGTQHMMILDTPENALLMLEQYSADAMYGTQDPLAWQGSLVSMRKGLELCASAMMVFGAHAKLPEKTEFVLKPGNKTGYHPPESLSADCMELYRRMCSGANGEGMISKHLHYQETGEDEAYRDYLMHINTYVLLVHDLMRLLGYGALLSQEAHPVLLSMYSCTHPAAYISQERMAALAGAYTGNQKMESWTCLQSMKLLHLRQEIMRQGMMPVLAEAPEGL